MYNGILLSPKKERNNVICSSKAGPRDYHISEVSYLEKYKCDMISCICGI